MLDVGTEAPQVEHDRLAHRCRRLHLPHDQAAGPCGGGPVHEVSWVADGVGPDRPEQVDAGEGAGVTVRPHRPWATAPAAT